MSVERTATLSDAVKIVLIMTTSWIVLGVVALFLLTRGNRPFRVHLKGMGTDISFSRSRDVAVKRAQLKNQCDSCVAEEN